MRTLSLALLATGFVLAATSPAAAGVPVQVPAPGTLSLLAVGTAAVAIGARWIRRR